MSNINLRCISNSFQDVRLVSLASWARAAEISPRDRGGPYVVTQEGYSPEDPNVTPDEFVLGRSGKWLSLSYFYRLSIPERRAEFVFGTAAEVMQMMSGLPSQVQMLERTAKEPDTANAVQGDEMAAAMQAAKPGGSKTA
jgi:hypothetical protein